MYYIVKGITLFLIFMEVWKDIPGFEGLYQASSEGRIKSSGNGKNVKPRILKQTNERYRRVCLYKPGGRKKPYLVHRLVYSAFYGEIPANMEVNHINENKHDNRLSNLNLLTRAQNNIWGTRCIRSSMAQGRTVQQYTLEGVLIATYYSASEAARQTNSHQGHLCACCRGELKTHNGFVWRYA